MYMCGLPAHQMVLRALVDGGGGSHHKADRALQLLLQLLDLSVHELDQAPVGLRLRKSHLGVSSTFLQLLHVRLMFPSLLFSSDRSSCTDDGLLYIRAAATFSDFEHLCPSILLQVSL